MTGPAGPILITGCSSGIGQASAARLARAGHLVYATARRPETLTTLRDLGCETMHLDLTDHESMLQAVTTLRERHGRIGALVNNAGYAEIEATELLNGERLRRQFDTNVFGPLRLCQLVLPAMREAGAGRIINVGSIGDRCVFPLWGGYTASKHALSAFTDALRMETRAYGVHVVLVEPGLVNTRFSTAIDQNLAGPRSGAYQAEHAGFQATLHGLLARLAPSGAVAENGGAVAENGGAVAENGGAGDAATTNGTAGARSLLFARLSVGPDVAACTIERALFSRRPRSRYRVPAHARLAFAARAVLPDRAWDAAVRTLFLGAEAGRPNEPGRPRALP
jgi:NADP-dependent 3-hydroxy acid dehydrogenase YdfG